MGNRIEYTQDEIAKMIDLYSNQKQSLDKIATLFGVSRIVIHRVLEQNGIYIRGPRELAEVHLSQQQIDEIIHNYVDLGMGLISSGESAGISQHNVKKILQQYGIKIRSYIESKDNLRKYTINDNYFKNQSHNMAYILGLLASDGNIAKQENQISICLEQKDAEILEKINVELENSRPVKYYFNNTDATNYAKLLTFSSTMKRDLSHYSIVPCKTFILQPPLLLAPEYYISYIRGYFDGDGCFSTNERNMAGCWEIVGASKPLIEWIREVLANNYHIYNNQLSIEPHRLSGGRDLYKTHYGGKEKLTKIFNTIYLPDSLYLSRKYEKIKEYLMK